MVYCEGHAGRGPICQVMFYCNGHVGNGPSCQVMVYYEGQGGNLAVRSWSTVRGT